MTHYKNFLIDSTLKCFLNHNGKLIPLFPQKFLTLEEAKLRIDRYWQEHEQYEARRKSVDYAKSLRVLNDYDRSDEAREIEAAEFEARMENHFFDELNHEI